MNFNDTYGYYKFRQRIQVHILDVKRKSFNIKLYLKLQVIENFSYWQTKPPIRSMQVAPLRHGLLYEPSGCLTWQ